MDTKPTCCNGKATDCGCTQSSLLRNSATQLPGKVLYGSQKGTAATYAHQLARHAASVGVEMQPVNIKDYEVEQLWKEHMIIFVLSTYENGSPPTSARSAVPASTSTDRTQLNDLYFSVLTVKVVLPVAGRELNRLSCWCCTPHQLVICCLWLRQQLISGKLQSGLGVCLLAKPRNSPCHDHALACTTPV